MIDGIVLAGGYSSRAKINKMMMLYKNKPLISQAIETMHQFCEVVIVVTGYYHDEMNDFLKTYNFVKVIYNENYSEGMFSSIKKGVKEVANDFFIIPGDYPKIKPSTYKEILDTTGDIRVPSFNYHLGHPIFFKKEFKQKLLDTKYSNLKEFRNHYDFTIIEVFDDGVLIDVDYIKDLEKLIEGNDGFDS
ncbi:MAG: hypothetical protein B6I17_03070 [Tenericutes bacterium 4572_104]|nr:MAG: hypothetical protein B6I17_03070 [Tenericutes bacterium 4572_104]